VINVIVIYKLENPDPEWCWDIAAWHRIITRSTITVTSLHRKLPGWGKRAITKMAA